MDRESVPGTLQSKMGIHLETGNHTHTNLIQEHLSAAKYTYWHIFLRGVGGTREPGDLPDTQLENLQSSAYTVTRALDRSGTSWSRLYDYGFKMFIFLKKSSMELFHVFPFIKKSKVLIA